MLLRDKDVISAPWPDLTDSSTPEIPALGCSYREGAGIKPPGWDFHHFDSSSLPGWTRLMVPREGMEQYPDTS